MSSPKHSPIAAVPNLESVHLDSAVGSRLRQRLMHWYRRNRRDLPWRNNRDPYRIWVSEIMLQQTQVATVIPYFERFLCAFPTLRQLAAAEPADVLRLWEGLGYYRRARSLHASARLIVADYSGQFPADPAILAKLPGIGRYTLGAILSQAFDQRLPILEANSRRLLSRWFGLREDPRSGPGERWLWKTATELLPRRGSGEFNQALMELGALICTSAKPRCSECPLAKDCVACQSNLQDAIPALVAKTPIVKVREVAVIVHRGSRVLLVQRANHGRWPGLWEFPHGPAEGEDFATAQRHLANLGIHAVIEKPMTTLRHSVTHFRITLVCLEARYRSGRFKSDSHDQGIWIEPACLAEYPVSAPQRRLAQFLLR